MKKLSSAELRLRFDEVKTHLHENKKVYIAGGIGVLAGAAGSYILTGKPQVQASQRIYSLLALGCRQNLVQMTVLERRGHPGNIIKCNETGELFASQNRAADMFGISRAHLSEHLAGKTAQVKGHTFEKIGKAT